jgi:hypothetical protein
MNALYIVRDYFGHAVNAKKLSKAYSQVRLVTMKKSLMTASAKFIAVLDIDDENGHCIIPPTPQ